MIVRDVNKRPVLQDDLVRVKVGMGNNFRGNGRKTSYLYYIAFMLDNEIAFRKIGHGGGSTKSLESFEIISR